MENGDDHEHGTVLLDGVKNLGITDEVQQRPQYVSHFFKHLLQGRCFRVNQRSE